MEGFLVLASLRLLEEKNDHSKVDVRASYIHSFLSFPLFTHCILEVGRNRRKTSHQIVKFSDRRYLSDTCLLNLTGTRTLPSTQGFTGVIVY